MHNPIDLVYLWVDPSDEKWAAERAKYAPTHTGKKSEDPNHDARFRDNDEFKYSLRSVAENAPWINHIYIVTGFGHIPKWLRADHPKITIVPHEQIMPADALPTFNASAIEMCIPNIPWLAERFLIANDDMFFNRPIRPGFFFDRRGRARVLYSRMHHNPTNADAYTRTLLTCARTITGIFGHNVHGRRPSHGIDPYIKSSWVECARHPEIAKMVNSTAHNKFRNDQDIQRWLFNLYDFACGRAVMYHSRARKFTRHKFANWMYNTLHWRRIKNSPVCCTNVMRAALAIDGAPIFCINDSVDSTPDILRQNTKFLETRFPNKCEFEL